MHDVASKIPDYINDRHAFAHERLLIHIAQETERAGSVSCSKRELAQAAGLSQWSIDRAVARLHGDGLVASSPCFTASGRQLGNAYHATERGLDWAHHLLEHATVGPHAGAATAAL